VLRSRDDLAVMLAETLLKAGLTIEDADTYGLTVMVGDEPVQIFIDNPYGDFPRKSTAEEIKQEWHDAWSLYMQTNGSE
jgi:hypothetical protein